MVTPRTLSGFKDRLPNEAIAKINLINDISSVFLSFGFMPIETPHIEYADILIKQGSEEIQKELYRFKDHGGRDIALRFDQTVPLARFITQHRHNIDLPFKRYAVGNVFRGERAQKGRYREFTQCDFDFIGSNSLSCDAEIIQVIYNSLIKLKLEEFTIWINHREILNGILKYFSLNDKTDVALKIIDKSDKLSSEEMLNEFQNSLNVNYEVAKSIYNLVSIKQVSSFSDFFNEISYLKEYNENLKQGIEDLESIFNILQFLSLDISVCRINFSIARGLGYYTGVVYETTLNRMKSIGSVCSGGRYDNLVENFSNEKLSGVGASIGIDRLLSALSEFLVTQTRNTTARILIIATKKEFLSFVHRMAENFRHSKISAEVYPDIVKIKKALNYANYKGHEFCIIIGDDEYSKKSLSIKNMTSGMQINNISFLKALEIVKN